MVLTIVILSTLCITLAYTTWNLLRKNERLDDEVLESVDFESKLLNDLRKTLAEMRQIDTKGGFESDDEVGEVFKSLKDVIKELENKYGEQ